jgi:hypothetical protein
MSDRQFLRDRYGTVIGQIAIEGTKQTLRDRYGYVLGWFDSTSGRIGRQRRDRVFSR